MRFLILSFAFAFTALVTTSAATAAVKKPARKAQVRSSLGEFIPKSSMICRDSQTGESVQISARTMTYPLAGYYFTRQVATVRGQAYRSFWSVIASQHDQIPTDDQGETFFRFMPAIDWRKAGYDYDEGKYTAEVWLVRVGEYGSPIARFDHCR